MKEKDINQKNIKEQQVEKQDIKKRLEQQVIAVQLGKEQKEEKDMAMSSILATL